MKSGNRFRRLGLIGIVPVLALLFWLTAVLASSFPSAGLVAVNVHSLTLSSYGNSTQRPAPLSLSVLADARQDARATATAAPTLTPGPTPVRTTVRPTATPSPTPTMSASPTPVPTPTITSSPTPTPPGTGTIYGQVLDSQTRTPIVGASVSAGSVSTSTDNNGNYSLSLNPGTYTVVASAPIYNSASQTVTVKAAQRLLLNFKLVSITAYGSVSGTVTNALTGDPVVGATVALSDGMMRITDANGSFSYAIVLNGSYTLTVSAVGYTTQSQPVTVKPGHNTNVQVSLTPA